MTQITKDNIAEVLKHNGIREDFCINDNGRHISIGLNTPEWCLVNFKNPKWVQIIEAHLGRKLEPLPESSQFDVVKVGQWIRHIPENKWYQRVFFIKCSGYRFECQNDTKENVTDGWHISKDDNNHDEWDLTDIRDYNPDEEIILNGKRYKLVE